jgi:hypothetical protein
MPSYQVRDTATQQLLAQDLATHDAAEAAADRIGDQLEQDLQRNSEGAGHIRLRLDIEKVTNGRTEFAGHHILLLGTDDRPSPLPAP